MNHRIRPQRRLRRGSLLQHWSRGSGLALVWVLASSVSLPIPSAFAQPAAAQLQPPEPRRAGEGRGPFKRLVIRGAMLIAGDGAPPTGPRSIVVEGNRIAALAGPEVATRPDDEVIDGRGLYVMPGMVDTHIRLASDGYDTISPSYAMKLLLAHGVTTIAAMNEWHQVDWSLDLQKQAAANRIVSPRLQVWADVSEGNAEELRARARDARKRGVHGLGEGSVYSGDADALRALLDEARKLGMPVNWHMDQNSCARFNALDGAKAGMGAMTHWYCLPETLLEGKALPRYPENYNAYDMRKRFAMQGRLWKQVAPPHSARWNQVLDEFLALDFTFEPTFSIYEINRDYLRPAGAEWNERYSHPDLVRAWVPNTEFTFAHTYDWSSTDETEWKENYRLWMAFINEYKNRGGRVVAGTDAGFMWTNFGFGLVRNLEMLQEAGFSPLEALDAATIKGAEHLRLDKEIGTIAEGKYADLVILDRDPLDNLKALYGTGYLSKLPDGRIERVGGVKYTIKDGIVYDAKALLADVEKMVAEARARGQGSSRP